MHNFTCGPSKADSQTRFSFGGERTRSSPSKLYLAHMRFLISGSLLVWIRSESIHHNLRSTFAKPLLIVRFFLRLKELKKNYAKTTNSCAILIKSFGETCFRIPYLFWGSTSVMSLVPEDVLQCMCKSSLKLYHQPINSGT